MALIHWLTLSLTAGIGPILTRRLTEAAGGPAEACAASLALLRSIEGIGRAKADTIFNGLKSAAIEAPHELGRVATAGARLICPDDQEFPFLLREIPDPPCVLYIKGTIEPRDLQAVAIVGSRRCSFYGREQAERFGGLLAAAGVCVISGGARGIDSAAHRGAMHHPNGRTIAVLGSGIDVSYPRENEKLFDQIATRGAVLSEYPIGTPPTPENFPKRNRIVSGMSRGVLVIEADEKSGALITARQAIEDHNRAVFAIPGRVDNAMSAGPHKLIREGATLVRNLEDILEALPPFPASVSEPGVLTEPVDGSSRDDEPQRSLSFAAAQQQPTETRVTPNLSSDQSNILAQFGNETISVDILIERTALPAPVVLRELTFLSLRGLVKRVDGQTFAKGRAR